MDSADTGDIHGALWVLAELAAAYKSAASQEKTGPLLQKVACLLTEPRETIHAYLVTVDVRVSVEIVTCHRTVPPKRARNRCCMSSHRQ